MMAAAEEWPCAHLVRTALTADVWKAAAVALTQVVALTLAAVTWMRVVDSLMFLRSRYRTSSARLIKIAGRSGARLEVSVNRAPSAQQRVFSRYSLRLPDATRPVGAAWWKVRRRRRAATR